MRLGIELSDDGLERRLSRLLRQGFRRINQRIDILSTASDAFKAELADFKAKDDARWADYLAAVNSGAQAKIDAAVKAAHDEDDAAFNDATADLKTYMETVGKAAPVTPAPTASNPTPEPVSTPAAAPTPAAPANPFKDDAPASPASTSATHDGSASTTDATKATDTTAPVKPATTETPQGDAPSVPDSAPTTITGTPTDTAAVAAAPSAQPAPSDPAAPGSV